MQPSRTACELSARARERYAQELFDIGTIATAIQIRAEDGYRDLRLCQNHPFDLSRTPAALALENWLDTNDYRYAWYPTRPVLDPLCSPSSEDYPELAIFW